MSQVPLRGGVDLCDNLPSSETLAALSQNLNDTASLTQAQSLSVLHGAAGEGREPIQRASLGSNEEVEGKAADAGGDGEAEEDEDADEVMMEEEEEEVSEGSSALIRCQSPDTPMTDSSYSETGRRRTQGSSLSQMHTKVFSMLLFATRRHSMIGRIYVKYTHTYIYMYL